MAKYNNGQLASSRLLADTKRLLRERDPTITLQEISRITGLNSRWLSHFNTNTSDAPAVDKVECLWRFLSGKELSL